MASDSDVTIHEERKNEIKTLEGKKNRREKSRDVMADMNARLARVELAMVDQVDQFKKLGQCIEKFEGGQKKLRGEMLGSLNVVVESCANQGKYFKDSLLGDINALRSKIVTLREEVVKLATELGDVKEDWTLCKMAVTQGGVATMPSTLTLSKVEIPKPKEYKGSRNVKEIDNFLWSLE